MREDTPVVQRDARLVRDSFFFFNDTATTEIYTLSLHDALPILLVAAACGVVTMIAPSSGSVCTSESWASPVPGGRSRSEEHTSELQSPCNLVCRLLLEKKKKHHNFPVYPLYVCRSRTSVLIRVV